MAPTTSLDKVRFTLRVGRYLRRRPNRWWWTASVVVVALVAPAAASPAAAFETALSWSRVTGATGYKVYVRHGSQSAVATSDAVGIDATSPTVKFRIAGLPLGPNIFFAISSIDSSQRESPRSNELFITYAMAARVVDSDGDGLTDAQEDVDLDQQVGPDETDPLRADTDQDGLDDAEEIALGTDPLLQDSDADGIIDSLDVCDDVDQDGFGTGLANGAGCPADNCPSVSNVQQLDSDNDGSGDPCDACTNIAGERNIDEDSRITLRRINTDSTLGNDVLVIRGNMQLPTATAIVDLNPLQFGARVLLTSPVSGELLDATLPPGAPGSGPNTRGWSYSGARRRWRYVDNTGSAIDGIRRVLIADLGRRDPGTVSVVVVGRYGDYTVGDADVPLNATIVIGDQHAAELGHCGQTRFSVEACEFNRSGSTLSCR